MQDGRKEYNRGRLVSYVVDSEAYSIIHLETDIGSEFKWGSDQKANFWVLTGGNVTCKLNSDAQLLDLLRAYSVVKLFMVVGRHEHNRREEEMPTAVNIGEEEMPTAVNIGEEMIPGAMDTDLELLDGGFTWAEVPEYGESTAGPPTNEEEEKKHFINVGCDPNGDEPAGVDEEWRYFKNVDHPVIDLDKKVEVQKRKRARPISETEDFDTEVVPDDEATMLDNFVVPHTSHDKENPIIKVGDTFADKIAFRHTIKQYAIKNEFETRIEHSDKERYRARCADENCDWRVFAKKLHGGNTFMVVKLSELDVHSCSSTNKMKGREASISWIAQKVKEVVKEELGFSLD